jgi:hypothetical protein
MTTTIKSGMTKKRYKAANNKTQKSSRIEHNKSMKLKKERDIVGKKGQ